MESAIIIAAKYFIAAPIGALLAYVRTLSGDAAKKLGFELLLALPLAYLLSRLAGLLFSHEQPFAVYGFEPLLPHDIDNSFPSDHMALSSTLATAAYVRHRTLGLSLWAFAGMVGIARVAAGLHYPEDIIAAAFIGVGAIFLARYLLALPR